MLTVLPATTPKCLVYSNDIVVDKAIHDHSVCTCIRCETPYHTSCHAYAGQCSLPGCGEKAVYLSHSITTDKSESKAVAKRPIHLPTESTAPQTVSDLCALDANSLTTEVDTLVKKYRFVSRFYDWDSKKLDDGHFDVVTEERYGSALTPVAKKITTNFLRNYVTVLDYKGESVLMEIAGGAGAGAFFDGIIKGLLYLFDVPQYDWFIVSSFLAAGSALGGIGSIVSNTNIGTPEYEKKKAEKQKQLKHQYLSDMKQLLG